MNRHYTNLDYLSRSRWASFYVQIKETVNPKPANVLEICKGFGLLSFVVRGIGTDIKTLDVDHKLKPDFIGDVRRIPLKANSFDVVTCFQVLEHLPFSDFKIALLQMKRVSKKYILLFLPEPYSTFVYFGAKLIPFIPKLELFRKFAMSDRFFPKFGLNSPHYWEIGRKGVSYQKVEKCITACQLKIIKSFYPKENLYHHVFVLSKL